jgi:hypothetical protein
VLLKQRLEEISRIVSPRCNVLEIINKIFLYQKNNLVMVKTVFSRFTAARRPLKGPKSSEIVSLLSL